jgi:hypothetical protein
MKPSFGSWRWLTGAVATSAMAGLAACSSSSDAAKGKPSVDVGDGGYAGTVSNTTPNPDVRVVPPGARAIASDSTGMNLVVVDTDVWTSTNGGTSWIDQTPSGPAHNQDWTSVASDTTGQKLVAVVNGFYDDPDEDPAMFSGDVWTSTNSGVTWTDRTASSAAHGLVWRGVASDATGTNLVSVASSAGALVPTGSIWTSTDSGATWTDRTTGTSPTGPQAWQAVASDATGQNLVAAGTGAIWTSTDGGASWTDHTPPASARIIGGFGFQSVASDATGKKLVAVVDTATSGRPPTKASRGSTPRRRARRRTRSGSRSLRIPLERT